MASSGHAIGPVGRSPGTSAIKEPTTPGPLTSPELWKQFMQWQTFVAQMESSDASRNLSSAFQAMGPATMSTPPRKEASRGFVDYLIQVDLDQPDEARSRTLADILTSHNISSTSSMSALSASEVEEILNAPPHGIGPVNIEVRTLARLAHRKLTSVATPSKELKPIGDSNGSIDSKSLGRSIGASIAKAGKRPTKAYDPDISEDDSDDEDQTYDITKHIEDQGLKNWRRPEHIDPAKLRRIAKKAEKHFEQQRPYLPKTSCDLQRYWAPQPSNQYILSARKSAGPIKTDIDVVRHRLTWAMSMVAVKALDISAAFWYIADLLEVADIVDDTKILAEYDKTRIQQIMTESHVMTSTDKIDGKPSTSADCRSWLSGKLQQPGPQVLKDILLD